MSSMPPIRRTIKNVVRNYSEAQVKVREATSNDPWGPSSTLMSEIADLTYNVVAFTEIMQMIWKRLNDHGKNWRHVYKALTLLDYIIKTGSEKVAQQCKENIFAIQTLKDFQYKEENKDQGMNVREKAKSLVQLLKDDERLRNERAKALKAKERFAQNAMGIGSNQKSKYSSSSLRSRSPNMDSSGGYSDAHAGSGMDTASPSPSDAPRKLSTDLEYARPSSVGEEEIQLQLALAMSKEEHDESVRRQKNDDIKLHLAMEESRKQADEERKREMLKSQDSHISSSGGLFSLDSPQTQPPIDPWSMPQPTHTATDPWGAPLPAPPSKGPSHGHASPTPAAAAVVDPWESPARTQQNQTSVSTDPWGGAVASGSPAYPTSTSTSASDPWGSQGVSSSSPAPPSSSSPWETAPAARASPFDNSFGASPAATTNGNGLDDDFDLLSGRNTSPGGTNIELEGFDPLGGQKSDAFDLTGMNQSLSQTQQQQSRKTPQEFLGDNANLVNLDQLVTKTSSTDTNPFANKSTNPFDQLQQQQQASTRRTLNQLQNNYHSSGFSQPAGGSLLPNPMVPHNGTQSTAQPSQQSYNPFL